MAQTHKVNIQNMKFDPDSITIAIGDTVEWTNKMSMPHTVAPDRGEFNSSGPLTQNKTFSHAFDQAGVVPYHCEIHPHMKGTVHVK